MVRDALSLSLVFSTNQYLPDDPPFARFSEDLHDIASPLPNLEAAPVSIYGAPLLIPFAHFIY
jgi:hypothetical protein